LIPLRTKPGRWIGLAVLLAGIAGCNKGPAPLSEVSGTVTMDGKPLAGCLVRFIPVADKSDNQQVTSSGVADASGNYTLEAADGRKGAVVGKHKVVVTWPRQDRDKPPPATPPPAIPPQYEQLLQTPIEKDVVAGSNTIPIEVKRQ
jgi:hypothetical protein